MKREKTRVTKLQTVLVLDLIGSERKWREFSGPITELS